MLMSVSLVSVTTHVSTRKGHSLVPVTQDSFSTETSDLVTVSKYVVVVVDVVSQNVLLHYN